MKTQIYYTEIDSPLGSILLTATEQGLCGLYFHDQRYFPQSQDLWQRDDARFASIRQWLQGYFAGSAPAAPEDFKFAQGTPFQHAVWQALMHIPLGKTCSYAEIAAVIGKAAAVRAVGAAIGRNPLSILVPCHRVIGSGGALTGYAGGLDRKRWLLAHEAAMTAAK